MKLEVVGKSFTYQWPGGQIRFESGRVIDVEEGRALRILAKVPGRVRSVESADISGTQRDEGPMVPPLKSGWLVTYRDRLGKLQGGTDDRTHGTVKECRREAGRWLVCLTDGQELFLERIVCVAKVNSKGEILGAWTVREHGYNGEKEAR